jgi:aryl-alcohol dehydrogenase-like predicted oxidoreductase
MPMYSWLRQQFASNDVRRLLEKVKQLAKLAGDLGVTLPKLALAWCLKNPNVSTVITGASKPEQVRENMTAGEVVDQLDDGVMKRIESILRGG